MKSQKPKVKSQNGGSNFCRGKNYFFHFVLARKRTGFTLIETVVALAILAVALAGPVTLATRSIFNTRFSKNKLTASQLAAEGIEIVRQKRDSNIMAGNDWTTNICGAGSSCSYQGDVTGAWLSCVTCNVALGYDSATGLYTQGCSTNCTSFTRVITVDRSIGNERVQLPAGATTITEDNRMRITSTVTWQDNIGPQSLAFTEILYNWR